MNHQTLRLTQSIEAVWSLFLFGNEKVWDLDQHPGGKRKQKGWARCCEKLLSLGSAYNSAFQLQSHTEEICHREARSKGPQ